MTKACPGNSEKVLAGEHVKHLGRLSPSFEDCCTIRLTVGFPEREKVWECLSSVDRNGAQKDGRGARADAEGVSAWGAADATRCRPGCFPRAASCHFHRVEASHRPLASVLRCSGSAVGPEVSGVDAESRAASCRVACFPNVRHGQ